MGGASWWKAGRFQMSADQGWGSGRQEPEAGAPRECWGAHMASPGCSGVEGREETWGHRPAACGASPLPEPWPGQEEGRAPGSHPAPTPLQVLAPGARPAQVFPGDTQLLRTNTRGPRFPRTKSSPGDPPLSPTRPPP